MRTVQECLFWRFCFKIWLEMWALNIKKKLMNKIYSTFKCDCNAGGLKSFDGVLRKEIQK